MDVRREDLRAGLHRANGVLNWRGVPENHPVRENLDQFRKIVADLDRCFEDASREQIDALRDAHDRVSRSMPDLLRKQSADDLLMREAELLNTLLETANRHREVWSALRARIEACYASLRVRAPARLAGNLSTRRRKTASKPESEVD
jgi:light-regulated signal transduction histidine kinase (bacteriophytochrome)